MRVLKVFNNLRQGGAERIGLDVARALTDASSIEVKIALVKDDGNEYQELSKGLDIYYCPTTLIPSISGKGVKKISSYEKLLDSFRPDIVHTYTYYSELVAHEEMRSSIQYLSHFHYKYPVFHFEGTPKTFLSRRKAIAYYNKKRLQWKYRDHRCHFIAISTDNLEFYKRIVPSARLHFLPNAIDFKKFNRGISGKNADYDQELILISVGRLDQNKNQIFLLDVANLLRQQKLPFRLILLGNGESRKKIEDRINHLGLENEVQMAGTVANVEDYLHKAHIYLHPAYSEAAPIAPLEAMAAGLPYISFDNFGNRDILKHSYNGFMIEERKAEVFLKPILKLVEEKKEYERISQNAVQFSSSFDLDNYKNKLIKLYEEISN